MSGHDYYAAVLLFESTSPAESYRPLYEETITVVRADSLDDAAQRVQQLAKGRECVYQNEDGEIITVVLKHIVDVSVITDDLGDGGDVYSRHFRNYGAYRTFEPLLSGEEL